MSIKTRALARSRVVFPVAVLFACGCSILTASAEEVRSETVKFKDLSLDTPAGVQALYRRIHAAAQRVCLQTDPIGRAGAAGCAKQAESRAVEKVGNPQLTAYYQAKTGKQSTLLAAAKR
ncbi:MAG: UrcA family protein [Sinobacteraceae bacterium]|nr:UrcA family protein [Nevskiaceae bacterium]